ncbi:MAG TPA: molecular chaperone TorD family protein [Thermomicrobiales bacterium]|nr:molecular chaperone TorD family protein [Thermomicrobiales bacterium]
MREYLSLLASAWLLEPDQAALDELAGVPGLAEAAASVTPEEAAVEYSRVVLGLAPPYASLFLHEAAMLNGPEAERVELIYRRFGFEIAPEWRAGAADHLGVELHFLAHLLERGDAAAAGEFLRAHVLTWAPVHLLAIERLASARLYPRLATVTLEHLLALRADLAGE